MTGDSAAATTSNSSPFFLLYSSRSGSTFLARLLIEHLGAVIPPEARFLAWLLSLPVHLPKPLAILALTAFLRRDRKFADWNLDRQVLIRQLRTQRYESPPDLIDGIVRFYLREIGAVETAIGRFGFKKGDYGRFVGRLIDWYPTAKFICLIRDGRAVFNSQRKSLHSERARPMEINPAKAARSWMAMIDTFESAMSRFPLNTMMVRYEDLIADPTTALRGIGAFLGLAANGSIPIVRQARAAALVPDRFSTVHRNVFKPPICERVDAWRTELPAAELDRFERIARGKLQQYGY